MLNSKNFRASLPLGFNLFSTILVRLALLTIGFYRRYVSSFLGIGCRFTPTCSEYSYEAFKTFGLLKGLLKSLLRISKCHPLGSHGYDPVTNTNKREQV